LNDLIASDPIIEGRWSTAMTPKKSSLCRAIDVAVRAQTSAHLLFAGCLLVCVGQVQAAIYTVNTSGDPGPSGTTSLRQALAAAATSDDSIVEFDTTLTGSTITLMQGAIAVQGDPYDLAVVGPGSRYVTISGNDASGVFIFSGAPSRKNTVSISGLSLTHGNALHQSSILGGGALLSTDSNIVLDDVRIMN
jgi:hypothetical protein